MSGPRLDRSQLMERLQAEEFVKRFPHAYIEDPKMTPEIFYEILCSVKFDIKEAQLKVIALVRKPGEFIIPAACFEPSLPTPPLSSPTSPESYDNSYSGLIGSAKPIPSIEIQGGSRRSSTSQSDDLDKSRSNIAASVDLNEERVRSPIPATSSYQTSTTNTKRRVPIEDSDDEILPPAFLSKRNRTHFHSTTTNHSPTLTASTTRRVCGFPVDTESDEDDEPPRPATRDTVLPSSQTLVRKKGSLRQDPEQLHLLQISCSEDNEEIADGSILDKDIKIRRTSCQRGFSTAPDFGDESDYEVPVDNEELRDISPDYWPSTPAVRIKRHYSEYTHEKQTLGSQSKIWVTPLIANHWKKYYPDSIEEVPTTRSRVFGGQAKGLEDELQELRIQAEKHTSASISEVKLNSLIQHDRKLDRRYFASADIDGVRYAPGEYVMVASQGLDVPEKRAGLDDDTETGSTGDPWFAQIIYIFQDEHDEKLAHLRWFEHGSRTLLGQTASSRELFLFQSCDDNPLGCIIKKISVELVQRSTEYDMESVETSFNDEGNYFYRQYWHPESRSFTHVAASQPRTRTGQEQLSFCECCFEKTEKTASEKTQILGTITCRKGRPTIQAFIFQGTTYRLYDFVYVVDGQKEVYAIGQVTKIYLPRGMISAYNSQAKSQELDENLERRITLRIASYQRYDDLLPSFYEEIESGGKHKVRDSRRLFATGSTFRINAADLDGKCFVFHRDHIDNLDNYKNQNNTFWVEDRLSPHVNPRSSIRLRDLCPLDRDEMTYSTQSKLELSSRMKIVQDFEKQGPKPQTLELFNGIGGLTIGFQGICGMTNAVEIDEAACHTMTSNQPDTTVHQADASLLLSRAIRRDQGEELDAIYDRRGNLIPDLPRRGEVDFIKGGPPCPGFSGANSHKRVAEPRNGLVALFLAYVNFYQPKYSLIENVVGLIRHDLVVPQESENSGSSTEVEIKHGTIKMIFRTYTSMVYQVQCAILNAEEHGTPQSRPRVFIWATLPGYRLP
ncbi:hypothetical protein ONS96_003507 [Cadophora gregata f. sp. sojae]|nr:hypothetical protein ONS96_003507 [Cadophora gregata f. sp. sojae]